MALLAEKTGLQHSFKRIFGEPMEKFCDREFTAMTGKFYLDMEKFDAFLSKKDCDYDYTEGTYKGEECSMEEYLSLKYGETAVKIINKLM